jgi:Ni/Fe-hydrogenase 1 B-type cytochrome subunit
MAAPTLAPETIAPPATPREDQLEPTYVWDLVVRATHWLVAVSIVLLTVTGIYIGTPFSAGAFVMGWAKVIHFYTAIVFTLAVFARLVWMFLGPRRSGWRNFVPVSRRRWRDLWTQIQFYALLRSSPARTIGHNPLAGLSYVAVFGMYMVMIATGFALYSVSSYSFMSAWSFLLPLFQGVQGARWLHHVTMWLLLMFVVAHMFFAMLTSRSEKNGTFDSIFSGYKYLPKGLPPDDE